jgi:trehalose utilization protein
MAGRIRVTVWSEARHEKQNAEIAKLYPDGIHGAIAAGLAADPRFEVRTATLDEEEHGLTREALADTDVLTWWGHVAHDEVKDEIVDRVQRRVIEGMGLIVLHAGHWSKIFKRMMGTTCALRWREAGEKERLWVVEPGHPIADGLPPYFELPHEEMYGERFDIPDPDAVVFISWFAGGNVFRSGCTFTRGKGRIFYFRPGHETHPTYHDANVRRVIANAVRWAAPGDGPVMKLGNSEPPLERL